MATTFDSTATSISNAAAARRIPVELPEPRHLPDALSALQERFFVAEEFPHLPRERFPQGVLASASALCGRALEDYAYSLKGRQLEGLLWDLVTATDPTVIRAGIAILTLRATQRLVKLFNRLWQYHFQAPGIREAAITLGEAIRSHGFSTGPLLELLTASAHHDPIRLIRETLEQDGGIIAEFNQKYQLDSLSPLAMAAYLDFLTDTDLDTLKRNRVYLAQLIKEAAPEDLEPLITNYLNRSNLETYEQAVNLAIAKRLGQPYTGDLWEPYNGELKRQFALWCFWYELFKHFIHQPKKLQILSPYLGLIRGTEKPEQLQNALIIDFGNLLVLDIASDPCSYFCRDKDYFWAQMNKFREEGIPPEFFSQKKSQVSARDFIIELKDAPCIILDYESVNIFYIKEMLDILIELEPDMRKIKLATR